MKKKRPRQNKEPRSQNNQFSSWLEENNLTVRDVKRLVHAVRNYQSRQAQVYHHDFSGQRLRLGIVGDTHFGNRWTDKMFLDDVMKYFKREGVEAVYHTGDMTDGPWQRHNNVMEQYAHGFEAQTEDFIKDFPDIGKPVFVISGNHDDWYIKMGAGDVGRKVAEARPDITYLGQSEAVVKLGKIEMMLHHPGDGSAYAYSYKPQKFIEAMFKMQEKIPAIILQGHYHKLFQMHFGGTAYYCTGTTERQTPFMRGKNIAGDMGAWMLDIHRSKHGELSKVVSTLLPHTGDNHNVAVR